MRTLEQMPMVVGVTEIAEAFGVSKQAVSNWNTRGLLPEPTANLRMGPIWMTAEIIKFRDAKIRFDRAREELAQAAEKVIQARIPRRQE